VGRDQVELEVISEGSRGVLGFGAENARVRLTLKLPAKLEPEPDLWPMPEPRPEPKTEPWSKIEAKPEPKIRPEVVVDQEPEIDAAAPAPEAAEAGREILSDLLRLMGIHASVEIEEGDDLAEEGQPTPMVLNITGDDLGILIGRRGETLRTLQYLIRLMVSHRLKHWTDLVVDVEHYCLRRRHALESLSERVAERVAKERRPQALEPMPSYERRIVHITLRNHPKVLTQSVGEGERRKVTIVPR
jgi:spoIIIJ-associated protein